jgi:hypothetical protein
MINPNDLRDGAGIWGLVALSWSDFEYLLYTDWQGIFSTMAALLASIWTLIKIVEWVLIRFGLVKPLSAVAKEKLPDVIVDPIQKHLEKKGEGK